MSPGEALDGEVLVDGADQLPRRLEHDVVVGVVGNRAAGGERRQPRAAAAAQHAVDRVAMQVRAARPARVLTPRTASARHPGTTRARGRGTDTRRARARRARPPSTPRRATSATICCARTSSGASGMITRSSSPRRTASSSAAHSTSSSRDSGNSRAFGTPPHVVARPARALQERRDRPRRSDLADEVDVADVDAELERRRRDEHLELAVLEPLLGVEPALLRHAAVVRHDVRRRRAARTDAAPRARPCAAC